MERLRHHLPIIVLCASLGAAFALRYAMVMQYLDMGQDVANYLVTMKTFFGHDVTGVGLLRPPLIAIPLKLFTIAFGDLTGVKTLGVLASVAMGIPFFLLAKRLCHPWIAVAITIGFVFSPAYSNMLAWGYLTMIGIFFTLLTFHFLLLLLERPSWPNAILTGLFASLVVGFHQISFVILVILTTLFLLAILFFNRRNLFQNPKYLAASAAVALFLAAPYIPTYLHLLRLQASSTSATLASSTSATGIDQFIRSLSHFHPPGIWFWSVVFILAVIGLRFLWKKDRNLSLLLIVMALLPLITLAFRLPTPFDELSKRSSYFIYVSLWLLSGITLSGLLLDLHLSPSRPWLPRAACIVLIVALLPLEIISSQRYLRDSMNFYSYLDNHRYSAIEWIVDETEPEAALVAYPHALGWWVNGKAERASFTLLDRNHEPYVFTRENSLTADRVLSRNQGLENGNIRLATAYPYNATAGSPALGIYVGGIYQDVLFFDDPQTFLQIGNTATTLADAHSVEIRIIGDGTSMQTETAYLLDGVEVIQRLQLDRGSHSTSVSYTIDCNTQTVGRFVVPILFCHEPESVSVSVPDNLIEITQELNTVFDDVIPAATEITFTADGARLQAVYPSQDRVEIAFDISASHATLSFMFSVTNPRLESNTEVLHYEVPRLLQEHGIDYVAIDLKPNSDLWSNIPAATAEWLNNCPYYSLVYSEGDIRVYQVDASALP